MVLLSHLSLTFYPYLHAFGGKSDLHENEIQTTIHNSPFGFFFSGTSAVFIFFVLSGFILTKVALKKSSSPTKVLSMSVKRYPRLMIPALTSCLIAYLSFLIFDIKSANLTDWINNYGKSQTYSLIDAVYSGMIDVFFVSGRSSYNPVLWTMMIELFGSLIVYGLCLNRMVLNIPFLACTVLIATILLTISKAIDPNLGLGLCSFYGGYLFSIYGTEISSKLALPLAIFGLYLAGAHNTSFSYSWIQAFMGDYTYYVSNFLSGFFIVYAILYNSRLNNLFSGKIPVFMGKVSFSVYLLHMPILSVLGVSLFNCIYRSTGLFDFSAMMASVITITLIYILSLIFYKFVDSKAMTISNFLATFFIAKIQAFSKSKYIGI